MTLRSSRLLGAAAWLAMAVTLALPAMRFGRRFNSVSQNPANSVSADSPDNYLRLYSGSTDPSGLAGYAVKRGTSPTAPAATGSDLGLTVALGGFKNQPATTLTRVLTVQALSPLPSGVGPLTITPTLAADPVTGRQPITAVSISNLDGSGAAPTATLAAGAERQLNVTVRTQPSSVFPGNNILHTATVTLAVTYPGYSGDFLTYPVPVSVWDGNGAGP